MATIGEEIKQKEFKSVYNKMLVNILFTTSWLNGGQNQIFKKYSLTPQQFNSLRILRGQYPKAASVNLLKDRMIDKMSNVSRIVDKLKAKDMVTREPCEYDRRQVDVKITDKGLKLLEIIDVELQNWEKGLHNLSSEEANQLNHLLDKLRG